MVMAKRRDGSAPQPPREAACAVDTWHVEQIARRPAELDGEASPLIEEPARVIDGLPPFRIRNPHRLLDLQPRPSVGIGRRDTAHCHAFAFFNFGFVGFGRGYPAFQPQRCDNLGFVLFGLASKDADGFVAALSARLSPFRLTLTPQSAACLMMA